jgi:hypothetical protein
MSDDMDGAATGYAASGPSGNHLQLLRDVTVLRTAEGARLLDYLRRRFGGSTTAPGDPVATHARSAQRDVILLLERLLRQADAVL